MVTQRNESRITFIYNQQRRKIKFRGKLTHKHFTRMIQKVFNLNQSQMMNLRLFSMLSKREFVPKRFCSLPIQMIVNQSYFVKTDPKKNLYDYSDSQKLAIKIPK
jgi:hypothetical protein